APPGTPPPGVAAWPPGKRDGQHPRLFTSRYDARCLILIASQPESRAQDGPMGACARTSARAPARCPWSACWLAPAPAIGPPPRRVVALLARPGRGHRACRGPRPFLCTGIATSPALVPLGNRHAWETACARDCQQADTSGPGFWEADRELAGPCGTSRISWMARDRGHELMNRVAAPGSGCLTAWPLHRHSCHTGHGLTAAPELRDLEHGGECHLADTMRAGPPSVRCDTGGGRARGPVAGAGPWPRSMERGSRW